MQRAAQEIVSRHQDWLRQMGIPTHSDAIPFYYAIAKMHKSPPKLRFIAGSRDVTTTEVNKLLTRFLGGLSSDLAEIWAATVTQIPGFADTPAPWLIKNSAEMIPRLQALNRCNFLRPVELATYDFERLYTNLPLQELRDTLNFIIWEAARHHHESPAAVCIFLILGNRSFGTSLARCRTMSGRTGGVRWKIYYLNALCHKLAWLLQNTYIQFGGALYKQTLGIPMGGNAAVHIVNYFLFAYELQFMRTLAAAIREHPPGEQQLHYTSLDARPRGTATPRLRCSLYCTLLPA